MPCVICIEPGPALCSKTCRSSATRELETNLATLYNLPAEAAPTRNQLVGRNGQLTSALVGSRPSTAAS